MTHLRSEATPTWQWCSCGRHPRPSISSTDPAAFPIRGALDGVGFKVAANRLPGKVNSCRPSSSVVVATADGHAAAIPAGLGAVGVARVDAAASAVIVVRAGIDAGATAADLVTLGARRGAGTVTSVAGSEDADLARSALVPTLAAIAIRPVQLHAFPVAIRQPFLGAGEAAAVQALCRPGSVAAGHPAAATVVVVRLQVDAEAAASSQEVRDAIGDAGAHVADRSATRAQAAALAAVARIGLHARAGAGAAVPPARAAGARPVIANLSRRTEDSTAAAIRGVATRARAAGNSPAPGVRTAHGRALAADFTLAVDAMAAGAHSARAAHAASAAIAGIDAQVRAAGHSGPPGIVAERQRRVTRLHPRCAGLATAVAGQVLEELLDGGDQAHVRRLDRGGVFRRLGGAPRRVGERLVRARRRAGPAGRGLGTSRSPVRR